MGLLDVFNQLTRWAERRHGPRPLHETIRGLSHWDKTALGRTLIGEQRDQIDEILSGLFGYHLLELSCFDTVSLSSGSRINHRFRLSPTQSDHIAALASPEELPLASECLDVVLLHHVLDYSPHPHQVLREANRALIARGHLIIVGFNPWSLQGLHKIIAQWLGRGDFWRRHSLRSGRVIDWLHLLDCTPIQIERGFYRMPVNHDSTLGRFQFWETLCRKLKLPFGGYYIIVATKDRVSMKPIKPSWKGINPIAGLSLGKPAGRMPEPTKHTVKPAKSVVRGQE
ncbi:MAG: methyltransferase [Cellvibrionaceae bacterium]|nr:methyltransferase [Cellvibrionaceae bacterium]|tara:strand:- start:29061 stop:29912 length:852 start_codon:yes stop_codon:yes gene_type:complete